MYVLFKILLCFNFASAGCHARPSSISMKNDLRYQASHSHVQNSELPSPNSLGALQFTLDLLVQNSESTSVVPFVGLKNELIHTYVVADNTKDDL